MTRIMRVRIIGTFFVFLTIVVYSLVPLILVNAATPPTSSETRCLSIAESPPGILRCGIKAVADGFVSNLDPDHENGNSYAYCIAGVFSPAPGCDSAILVVEQVPSVPQQMDEAYVKFDLRNLPSYLLSSHAQPANASLWLFTDLLTFSQNATVQAHRVLSNDWSESNLTWNTRPAFAAEYVSQQVGARNTWVEWNVLAATETSMTNSSEVSFALTPGGTSAKNYLWFRSIDYSSQSGNLTTAPELDVDFIEPRVTVLTPFSNITVNVDQIAVHTDEGGKIQIYLPWGQHQISVPAMIPINQSMRRAFSGWSDGIPQSNRTINVGGNLTLGAGYGTQYKVEANSPYSFVTGDGWYFENTTATISVSPTNLFADGVLGYLGVRHKFDHWSGACTSIESQCTILVNGPKSAYAQWRDDFTIPLLAVLIIVFGIASAVARFSLSRRTRTPRR